MEQIGVKLLFCYIVGIISLGNRLIDDYSEYCSDVENQRICYIQVSTQNLNWMDANQVCKENFTLPVIRNAEEQINFEEYLNHLEHEKANISDIWLSGRFVKFKNWTWINGQAADVNVKSWRSSLEFQTTHAAVEYDYLEEFPIVIQHSPLIVPPYIHICQFDGECDNGAGYQLENSCLSASGNHKNWHSARLDCVSRGGDLPVLIDLRLLRNIGKNRGLTRGFWIGLRRGMWTWVLSKKGSEEIRYLNWRDAYRFRYFEEEDDDEKEEEEGEEEGSSGSSGSSGVRYYDERREEKEEEECLSVHFSNKKWEPSPCARRMSVICQRRGVLSAGDNGEQWYLGKGAFTILMITVAVLVCVAIGVIVWLAVTKKTASSERQLSPDRQHQDIQKPHHVYSDPKFTDHYDAIELRDAGDQDLETTDTYAEMDTTDDYETIDHERESAIE